MTETLKQIPDELPAAFGRYRLLKLLGQGGMGRVYLAHDTQLDRPVALKIPQLDASAGSNTLTRFYIEARAAAALHHPNICPIHDVGEINGLPYLTMAYIEGKPLGELARARPLLPRQSAVLIRKLALALQEAHKSGIIHRDLKPANIMIDRRGEPVIMDFGLARRTRKTDTRVTQEGATMGTPAYIPPEQVQGDVNAMGPASDIYSLGVVLYELLTGRLPFTGDMMVMLSQVLMDEPPPPSKFRPDLEPELEAICLKAMAKKIENRYRSMAELAAALFDYLRNKTMAPEPVLTMASTAAPAADAAPADPRQQTPGIHISQMGGFRSVANLHAELESRKNLDDTPRTPRPTVVSPKKKKKKKRRSFLARHGGLVGGGLFVCLIGAGVGLALLLGHKEPSAKNSDTPVTPVTQAPEQTPKKPAASNGDTNPVQPPPVLPAEKTPQPVKPKHEVSLPPAELCRDAFNGDDGAPAHVYRVTFSPNGRHFLAAGDAGNRSPVRIYDGKTGSLVSQFVPIENVGWTGGRFSPDGTKVVSWGSTSSSLYVWQSATARQLLKLDGHREPISVAAFSPDGKWILSGSADRTLRLWDAYTGATLRIFRGHAGECGGCFSPTGTRIISWSSDRTVRCWGPRTGMQYWQLTAQPKDGLSRLFAAAANRLAKLGTRFLTFDGNGSVRVSNMMTGVPVAVLAGPAEAHGASFLPGGWQIVTWGKDRTLRVWNVENGKMARSLDLGDDLQGEPDNGIVSQDGRLLLTGHTDQTVQVRDLVTGKELHRFQTSPGTGTRSLAFSPDGRFAAGGSFRGWVYLWRLPAADR